MTTSINLDKLTQTELAKLFNVSTTTIYQWEKGNFDEEVGPFPQATRDGVSKIYNWRACLSWYVKQQAITKYKDLLTAQAGPEGVDFDIWKAREKKANALMAETELEEAQARVIPIKEVERKWSDIVQKIKSKFMTVPSRLGALIHPGQTAAEIEDTLDREVREVLKELSEL